MNNTEQMVKGMNRLAKENTLLRTALKTMREEFYEKSCASAIIIYDEVMEEINGEIDKLYGRQTPIEEKAKANSLCDGLTEQGITQGIV